MAKVELRSAVASLLKEKTVLDNKLTACNDRYTLLGDQLMKLRAEQQGYKLAKEHLSNSNTSKAARRVFDNNIAEAQRKIDQLLVDVDMCEKERISLQSQSANMAKSIKELQSA